MLEFPLTELIENRDYPGSSHFFFDIGNGNLLAFFDFPGLDVGPYAEVLGGLHHMAISVEPERWQHLVGKLDEAGVEHVVHSGVSVYFTRPRRRPDRADRRPARRDVRDQGALMSGPCHQRRRPAVRRRRRPPHRPCIEVSDSREELVGRMRVRRALPRRGRRTVGAWCFADHMGPADVTENSGLDIGPHPHIGLQTVTWLVDGQALHRDSLGSEQVIAPGQLNLMTAGAGVVPRRGGHRALPRHARGHPAVGGAAGRDALRRPRRSSTTPTCRRRDLDGGVATVLMGELRRPGQPGPARHRAGRASSSPCTSATTVPLRPDFEYAVVVLEGAVAVRRHTGGARQARLPRRGTRRARRSTSGEPTRALLLGGEPFEEPIVMWWNFVGPHPRRDRRRVRLLGGAGRPVRHGRVRRCRGSRPGRRTGRSCAAGAERGTAGRRSCRLRSVPGSAGAAGGRGDSRGRRP